MNYYKRHLGDYAKDTGHLSALEHGVYTLLLDRYYSTEKPIPQAEAYKVARARTADERAAADGVLREFFKLKDGEWHHSYCDEVIEVAHEKAGTNRQNGKLGGRPKKASGKPTKNPEETQTVSGENPEITLATIPLATSQEKETTAAAPPRPQFSENFETAWAEYPKRNGDNPKRAAAKAWSARITAGRTPAEMIDGVRRYAAWCRDTGKAGTETVMQAKRFFGPDEPFKNAWSAAPEKVKVVIPDCNVPGCKREGLPGLGGKCEIHYNQSRPLTPAQIAAGIA